MKLYNGLSPNGARVAIFLAEKGRTVETENIDIAAGQTRGEAYLSVNSLGQVPALELDRNLIITESVAICRYFESLWPTPALFGSTAEDQAVVEMWNRRMELHLFNVIGDAGRHELPLFKDVVEQNPDYAAAQRREFGRRLAWLDGDLSNGRPFISGGKFTIADITGMAMLMLCMFINYPLPDELTHLKKWQQRVLSRPSFPQMPG